MIQGLATECYDCGELLIKKDLLDQPKCTHLLLSEIPRDESLGGPDVNVTMGVIDS